MSKLFLALIIHKIVLDKQLELLNENFC